MMERRNVSVVICFNKMDLLEEKDIQRLHEIYEPAGYRVLTISVKQKKGIEEVQALLDHKVTVVAGPSGVGKSSLTNSLQRDVEMETGEISKKLNRGKHTTRHSQLIELGDDSWFVDTPGFSSLYLEDMEKEELRLYFPEFDPYEGQCRYQGCTHTHEPGCAVKEALSEGRIEKLRYEGYLELYEELKDKKKM